MYLKTMLDYIYKISLSKQKHKQDTITGKKLFAVKYVLCYTM